MTATWPLFDPEPDAPARPPLPDRLRAVFAARTAATDEVLAWANGDPDCYADLMLAATICAQRGARLERLLKRVLPTSPIWRGVGVNWRLVDYGRVAEFARGVALDEAALRRWGRW